MRFSKHFCVDVKLSISEMMMSSPLPDVALCNKRLTVTPADIFNVNVNR